MNVANPSVKKLLQHYKKISLLGKVKATLDWDLNVNMPPKGSHGRAEQSAYLEEILVQLWLDTDFLDTLASADAKTMTEEEKAIVRNSAHASKFYTKVPKALIIENAKVTSEAFIHWRQAREENNFKGFLPHLKKIIALNQKIAGHLGYQENLYDALLDIYEPALTTSFTKKAFDSLRDELMTLVGHIQKSEKYVTDSPLVEKNIVYPLEKQKELVLGCMKKMGFDMQAGRLDVSPHPFTTTLDRYDIRITNAYKVHDFRESYTAGMHETGHALYEQGIHPDYRDTPLEGGVSFGIHESLSRFWENMVGKNPAYLGYMTPIFQSTYPDVLGNVSEKEFVQLFTMVKPSFIRIEADEVTYALHIILRFEMEHDLLNGTISAEDAPEVWREKSKKYFGIAPMKDSQGILQDVHWAYGNFGYFPSYALGNLYGAQFLKKMKESVHFEEELQKGNLAPIKQWLDTHVHTYGSLYYPRELMKKATGEELNPKYFVAYLKEKYTEIYK